MAIDYEQICKDNIEEYGKGERHLEFFAKMYSDGTHFIFELVQNAEDADATQIDFLLFNNRLELRHNGRHFNDKDVRGVCGVGKSTKEHDLTQIGQFGIGFKSVYAFTKTPSIHCSNEHFEIRSYVRPYAIAAQSISEPWTTLITIPFDKDDQTKESAVSEIADRLRCLSAQTLLFLKNINLITYKITDEDSGTYSKHTQPCISSTFVTVISKKSVMTEIKSEQWLIFEKQILNDQGIIAKNGKPVPPVQIAFLLEDRQFEVKRQKTTSKLHLKIPVSKQPWDNKQVAALTSSPLVVFFPTEKESHLGFLIQGPYRTTPARDNIPSNDKWNLQLIKQTATLLASLALPALKKMGLLTVGCFDALPINMDYFPENGFFFPIADTVRTVLRKKQLLPAIDGSFTSANNALLGRGEDLRSLLGSDQLSLLFGISHDVKWLSDEITQDNAPALHDYLRNQLNVVEVTPDSIALRITAAFMERQSDEWVTSFYGTLLSWEALWKLRRDGISRVSLRDREFLRLENGQHVKPFDATGQPTAYLPLKGPTQLPVVKASVANDKLAREFLTRLGISEPDVVAEVIEELLPRYLNNKGLPSALENSEHMTQILVAWSTDSIDKRRRLKVKLQETAFIRYHCPFSGAEGYAKPCEVYFNDDDLLCYFEGSNDAKFMTNPPEKDSRGILRDLGVFEVPRYFNVDYGDPPIKYKSTGDDTVKNYILQGLDEFLSRLGNESDTNVRYTMASYLWQYLLAYAKIEPNIFEAERSYFYYSEKIQRYESLISLKLRSTLWLPKKDGDFGRPSDISIDQIHNGFEPNEKLILALGIQPDLSQQIGQERQTKHNFAIHLGINLEDAEFIAQNRNDFDQFMRNMVDRAARRQAIEEPSLQNRERRQIKLRERREQAPTKGSVMRLRTVSGNSRSEVNRQALFDFYIDDEEDVVFCQMCLDPMPFVKRNGEDGGECVDLFTQAWAGKSGFELKFLTSLKLVLCPVCSEVYRDYVHKDTEKQSALHEHLTNGGEGNFAVCDTAVRRDQKSHVLHFNQTHLADIRICLEQDDE